MRERLAHVAVRGSLRDRSVAPYVGLLKELRSRRRVRGVLLDISSGGGESVASTDLYLAVKRLNETKPVVASIGGLGASGAYLAALGARKIYAYPESLVGSIGVIFPQLAIRELVRRLGISVDLLHVGAHKDAFQGYRPLSDEERGKMLAVAQEVYDSFVAMTAEARHRPLEEIRALATGEIWTGARALALGLVDAVGDREEALQELARLTGVDASRTIRLAPPRPLLERMLGAGSHAFAGGLADRVRDSIEDALAESGGLLWHR
jgi:protease IV